MLSHGRCMGEWLSLIGYGSSSIQQSTGVPSTVLYTYYKEWQAITGDGRRFVMLFVSYISLNRRFLLNIVHFLFCDSFGL